jgi:outer membrane protein assembly factor BamB
VELAEVLPTVITKYSDRLEILQRDRAEFTKLLFGYWRRFGILSAVSQLATQGIAMKHLVFVFALGTATGAAGADWPQWRGPERTGISSEKGLLKEWPQAGPKLAWKADKIGTGYSSPSVVQGVVYTQTTRDGKEYAIALNEADGKEKWATEIGLVGKNQGPQYPGTRATPTVEGDNLYCLASDGELNCLTTSGKVVWHKNLAKEFDGSVGFWAYTESVLVDGDAVICTPGGSKATLVKLKKTTGDVIWKCMVPGGDTADYASIMKVEGGGKKQYVQYLRKALVGVDAESGQFLWKNSKTQDQGASVLTPIVDKNVVFVAGSRTGGAALKLSADGMGVKADEVYFDKAFGPSMGGAILLDGHLYFTSGQPGKLYCVEFATGKVKWTEPGVAASSLCYVDGRLYLRGWASDMVLAEVTPEKYTEKGRFKQPDRSKTQAWPHPTLANGKLYLRDMDTLLCFDVSEKK